MYTPLEQFKINSLIRIYNKYIDLSITNSTVMLLISILIILILTYSTKKNTIITTKWERLVEILYEKIEETVKETISKNETKYVPMIISLFLFILVNNLIGLIPYSFTTTSHIAITALMSLSIVIGITIIGFRKHSLNFFKLFIPSGLNQGFTRFIIPLIFFIELVSYLSRVISLSVRLSANMMSGHTMLKIISNFGLKYTLFFPYVFLSIPILVLIPMMVLEIGIAVIQAYVFTILTVTYIKDVVNLH